jgi:hypothetical protein
MISILSYPQTYFSQNKLENYFKNEMLRYFKFNEVF